MTHLQRGHVRRIFAGGALLKDTPGESQPVVQGCAALQPELVGMAPGSSSVPL